MCSQCNDPPLEIKQNQPNEKRFIKASEADHFRQDGNTDQCQASSITDQESLISHITPQCWSHLIMFVMTLITDAPGHTIRPSWHVRPHHPMSHVTPGPSLAPGLRCQILIDQSWEERGVTPRCPPQSTISASDTRGKGENLKWKSPSLRANDSKLSKVGIDHFIVYDRRGICEMSFEAFLGPIFCKIKA